VISGSWEAAADYYRTLTSLYRWYGADAHGWHYGVYDADVRGHSASLTRGNEILMEGIPRAASVLDVGCGEGGFAVWAAERGHRVLGITVCAEHVHLARALAESRRVDDRCRFIVANMDALALRGQSVDVVVNQETWCHSQSKSQYLDDVWRVLRPGGWFRSVDLSLGAGPRNASEEHQYQLVCQGFQVPSLVSKPEIAQYLEARGFTDVSIVDLSARVWRSALLILAFSGGPHLLTRLGLDRFVYGRDAHTVSHYRRHVAACMAFNLGLRRRLFRYLSVTARKPADGE
jgi:ubiquinone/menaquinone biosynthesis C-methylase UbiE